MPLQNAPAGHAATIIGRPASSRLVIVERLLLVGGALTGDPRPQPPADLSAEHLDAMASLAHGGFQLALSSHHPAVARGLLEMSTVNAQNRRLTRQLEEAGARIEAIGICPHAPDAGCDCRVPRTGMLLDLIDRFGTTPAASVVVAASRESADAGHAAGCQTWWVGDEAMADAGAHPLATAPTLAEVARALLTAQSGCAAGPVAPESAP